VGTSPATEFDTTAKSPGFPGPQRTKFGIGRARHPAIRGTDKFAPTQVSPDRANWRRITRDQRGFDDSPVKEPFEVADRVVTGLTLAGTARWQLDSSVGTELSDPEQVVGGADQVSGETGGTLDAPIARATEVADRPDRAENLLDPLAHSLAHRVARVRARSLVPPPPASARHRHRRLTDQVTPRHFDFLSVDEEFGAVFLPERAVSSDTR
jgi:hypothetical protein